MSDDLRPTYAALIPYTPFITQWSEEQEPPAQVVERPGRGIGYADETVNDRDSRGVLWFRMPSRPGQGRPLFTKVHPQRQRQAMRRLLCGVCGQPADQTAAGTLWLLSDFRDDWPGWPERMGVTEPPVCLPCVRVASRLCPALRKGCVAVRARRAPIAGVWGALYRSGGGAPPVPVGDLSVAYGDPAIRWVRAFALLRQLHDCVLLDADGLCHGSTVG